MSVRYSIIIPVYNEELVVEACDRKLTEISTDLNDSSELIFINDGSTDQSGS